MTEPKGEAAENAINLASLDTYSLLTVFIGILSVQAWQDMGLRIMPGKDKIEKHLDRAKTAIDCISYLIDRVDAHVSDEEKTRLRSLLADLQLNFVNQSK